MDIYFFCRKIALANGWMVCLAEVNEKRVCCRLVEQLLHQLSVYVASICIVRVFFACLSLAHFHHFSAVLFSV